MLTLRKWKRSDILERERGDVSTRARPIAQGCVLGRVDFCCRGPTDPLCSSAALPECFKGLIEMGTLDC